MNIDELQKYIISLKSYTAALNHRLTIKANSSRIRFILGLVQTSQFRSIFCLCSRFSGYWLWPVPRWKMLLQKAHLCSQPLLLKCSLPWLCTSRLGVERWCTFFSPACLSLSTTCTVCAEKNSGYIPLTSMAQTLACLSHFLSSWWLSFLDCKIRTSRPVLPPRLDVGFGLNESCFQDLFPKWLASWS